jgi:hypothetical protein
MSFVMGIIVVIFVYRFWDVLRTTESSTKKAVHSGLNALVKGAAKLEATTPNLTEAELNSIREGRRQLIVLEDIENLSDEELHQFFAAKEAKAKAKK